MTYLSKHNVNNQISSNAKNVDLPTPSRVNHFGLSPSSWFKKDPVPMVFDGVFIIYIEILQSILSDITKVKLVSSKNVTIFGTVSFDQKAISPGLCKYQNLGLGVNPIIKPIEAVELLENGYSKIPGGYFHIGRSGGGGGWT